MSKEKLKNNEKIVDKVMGTIKFIEKYDRSPNHILSRAYYERNGSCNGLKEYLLSRSNCRTMARRQKNKTGLFSSVNDQEDN